MAIHKHQNLYFQYRSKGGFEASGELINLMRTFAWKEAEGDQPLNTALAARKICCLDMRWQRTSMPKSMYSSKQQDCSTGSVSGALPFDEWSWWLSSKSYSDVY
jgi:hypothetical protein